MQIVSGLGKGTMSRLGFMFLLLTAFAVWFGYDGWVGYPRKNLEAALQSFPRPGLPTPIANPAVTEGSAKAVQAAADKKVTLDDLRKQWGEPAYLGPSAKAAGPSTSQVAFFVGTYGWAEVALDGQTASKAEWRSGPKVASDIGVQKLLGLGLAGGALIPLVLLLVQMSTRYRLDDEGLVLPKHGRITYDRMTSADFKDFDSKGIVRVHYRDTAGSDRTAVLDEEQIARFEDIVAALCEKKGWSVEVKSKDEPVNPGTPEP